MFLFIINSSKIWVFFKDFMIFKDLMKIVKKFWVLYPQNTKSFHKSFFSICILLVNSLLISLIITLSLNYMLRYSMSITHNSLPHYSSHPQFSFRSLVPFKYFWMPSSLTFNVIQFLCVLPSIFSLHLTQPWFLSPVTPPFLLKSAMCPQ